MGAPSPRGPGSVRQGGRSARAVALPTQARRHSARRVGDMRLQRAFGSPAWVNQTRSMPGPRGRNASANGAAGAVDVVGGRGGVGKSDPNAIVVEGMRLRDRLLWGWGHGTTDKMLDPKTKMHIEDLRWAPSPCVWENQQCSHPQQLNACSAWLDAALWGQS